MTPVTMAMGPLSASPCPTSASHQALTCLVIYAHMLVLQLSIGAVCLNTLELTRVPLHDMTMARAPRSLPIDSLSSGLHSPIPRIST